MILTATPLYAILLGAFFLFLSVRVILGRRGTSIGLGHGDNSDMERRIRAQGNAAEYIPLGLILLFLAEYQGLPLLWVHVAGVALLVGRVLHGLSLTYPYKQVPFRVPGMAITLAALICLLILNAIGLVA